VYGELARRGLILGEVGRGTFVRAQADRPLAQSGRAVAPVDLQPSTPSVSEQLPQD
jgi:DNA-binding GntR family transcriptional regulator